jgi:hypothetical protein
MLGNKTINWKYGVFNFKLLVLDEEPQFSFSARTRNMDIIPLDRI